MSIIYKSNVQNDIMFQNQLLIAHGPTASKGVELYLPYLVCSGAVLGPWT